MASSRQQPEPEEPTNVVDRRLAPSLLVPRSPEMPKNDREGNPYGYLTKHELVWLAGVIDSIGNIQPARVRRFMNRQRFLEPALEITGRSRAKAAIHKAADLLRTDVTENESGNQWWIRVRGKPLGYLMARLKDKLTVAKYNEYVRAHNHAEQTVFKLLGKGWEYSTKSNYGPLLTEPKRQPTYKGADLTRVTEFIKAQRKNPSLIPSHIAMMERQVDVIKEAVRKGQASE